MRWIWLWLGLIITNFIVSSLCFTTTFQLFDTCSSYFVPALIFTIGVFFTFVSIFCFICLAAEFDNDDNKKKIYYGKPKAGMTASSGTDNNFMKVIEFTATDLVFETTCGRCMEHFEYLLSDVDDNAYIICPKCGNKLLHFDHHFVGIRKAVNNDKNN